MAKSGWGRMNGKQTWTPLARDIDRALARAGLTTHEAALMQYVREYSWGEPARRKRKKGEPRPEAVAVAWSPKEIGERIGENPTRLTEAKDRLVRSHMLREAKAGLTINKNADEWLVPDGKRAGEPRLSAAALAYAMGAWPAPETSEIPEADHRKSGDDASGNPETNHRKSGGNPPEIRSPASGNPEAPLYEERAREDSARLDRREGERAHATFSPAEESADPPTRTPADAAKFEAAVAKLMGDMDTQGIGMNLSRNAHLEKIRRLEGWRFLYAADRILSPDVAAPKRRRWGYYFSIAETADPSEAAPAPARRPSPAPSRPASPNPASNLLVPERRRAAAKEGS